MTMSQNPRITINMSSGSSPAMANKPPIVVELDPQAAPNTVANFISLATRGFYDGLCFHRVIPGFMVQGGCPYGTGMGGPDYHIAGEFSENGFENPLKHSRGVISMARAQALDSAGSQFFIMVEEAPFLDGQYASFGTVLSGMETVDAIVAAPRDSSDRPYDDLIMESVTVEAFGVEYEEPETI